MTCCFLVACTTTAETDDTSKPHDAKAYVCQTDADCVMSCESRDECCTNPCGCDTVRHKLEHADIQRHNRAECALDDVDCPSAGACDPSYAYATPRCREGTCVAELPGSRQAGQ